MKTNRHRVANTQIVDRIQRRKKTTNKHKNIIFNHNHHNIIKRGVEIDSIYEQNSRKEIVNKPY